MHRTPSKDRHECRGVLHRRWRQRGVKKPLAMNQRLPLHRVFGLSKLNQESRRADSNRLPLLQVRVIIHAL
jgi:hypothetical protein